MNLFIEKWEQIHTMNAILICAVIYGYCFIRVGSDEDIKNERKNG